MAVQGLKPCAIVLGYTVQFSMCFSNRVCVLFLVQKRYLLHTHYRVPAYDYYKSLLPITVLHI